jgi:hypothetical protein
MLQAVTDVIQSAPTAAPLIDDRITMLLAAVGVAVAAATLALGIVSFYIAYIAFHGKKEIIQKAEAAAKRAAEEYLDRNEQLQELDEPAVEPEVQDNANEQHNANELG